jgi:hypothetical protein
VGAPPGGYPTQPAPFLLGQLSSFKELAPASPEAFLPPQNQSFRQQALDEPRRFLEALYFLPFRNWKKELEGTALAAIYVVFELELAPLSKVNHQMLFLRPLRGDLEPIFPVASRRPVAKATALRHPGLGLWQDFEELLPELPQAFLLGHRTSALAA